MTYQCSLRTVVSNLWFQLLCLSIILLSSLPTFSQEQTPPSPSPQIKLPRPNDPASVLESFSSQLRAVPTRAFSTLFNSESSTAISSNTATNDSTVFHMTDVVTDSSTTGYSAPFNTSFPPIGYMPVRRLAGQDVFVIDMIFGSDDNTILYNSFAIDTTGEYLTVYTPTGCSKLTIPQSNCVQPQIVFSASFTGANYYIDSMLLYCETCSIATDNPGLLWTPDGSSLLVERGKVDLVAVNKLAIRGTVSQPQAYNIFPIRGVVGLAKPQSTSRPVTSQNYQRPFADLMTQLVTMTAINTSATVVNTTYNYGLDFWLNSDAEHSIGQVEATILTPSGMNSSSQYGVLPTNMHYTAPQQQQSKIWLNGLPSQYRDSIQWSSPQSDEPDTTQFKAYGSNMPLFAAYNMSFCNIPLYSVAPVIVDSFSPCLTLPQAVFDSIMTWAPITCDYTQTYTADGNRQCYVSSTTLGRPLLPTLDFALSPEPTAPQLHLPLDQLLLPLDRSAETNFTTMQRICISTSQSQQYVALGSMALTALYFHADLNTTRYGLANKVAFQSRVEQCLPRYQCVGQEMSYEAFNLCIPANCNDYYFFQWDNISRTCRLHAGYPATLGAFIAFFFAIEALLFVYEMWLATRIAHDTSRLSLVQRSQSRRYQNRREGGTAAATAGTNEDLNAPILSPQQQQDHREAALAIQAMSPTSE